MRGPRAPTCRSYSALLPRMRRATPSKTPTCRPTNPTHHGPAAALPVGTAVGRRSPKTTTPGPTPARQPPMTRSRVWNTEATRGRLRPATMARRTITRRAGTTITSTLRGEAATLLRTHRGRRARRTPWTRRRETGGGMPRTDRCLVSAPRMGRLLVSTPRTWRWVPGGSQAGLLVRSGLRAGPSVASAPLRWCPTVSEPPRGGPVVTGLPRGRFAVSGRLGPGVAARTTPLPRPAAAGRLRTHRRVPATAVTMHAGRAVT